MESTAETVEIQRELTIAATPETVWGFLVEPEKATRWMGQQATFEPEPGGLYRVAVIPGNTARGEFVELEPPRRLVFTWGWEPGGAGPNPVPPGSTTVEIELEPDGDGTRLRFAHRGLPSPDSAESHGHGWDHYLKRLETAAAGGDPGTDPWLSGDMQQS
jgi:uncharacterized protein YndB with AHSA1/START domain